MITDALPTRPIRILSRREALKIIGGSALALLLSQVPGANQTSGLTSDLNAGERGLVEDGANAGTGPVPDGGKDLDSIKPLATANKPLATKEATAAVSPTKVPSVVEPTLTAPESQTKIEIPKNWVDAPRIQSISELLMAERAKFRFNDSDNQGKINVVKPTLRTPFTELSLSASSANGVKPVSCAILNFQSSTYLAIGVAIKQDKSTRFLHFAVPIQLAGVSTAAMGAELNSIMEYLRRSQTGGNFKIGGGISVGQDTAGAIKLRESYGIAKRLIEAQSLSTVFNGGFDAITDINSVKENTLIPLLSTGQ